MRVRVKLGSSAAVVNGQIVRVEVTHTPDSTSYLVPIPANPGAAVGR